MPSFDTPGRGPAPLQTLEHDDYLALRAGARVLERDHFGEKVLVLADGSYLKLFRRKRLISSAAWYPYAKRFADNALALAEREIPCPGVIGLYRIPSVSRDAVRYQPLEGQTLRQLLRSGADAAGLRTQLGRFVAVLHGAGVYFRSLHLGNIVLTPAGTLGLIDIADLRAGARPLPAHRRRRNLQHLLRDAQDRAWLQADTTFDAAYRAALEALRR
ncbi:MAG: toluene tolerance protein [Betaproteobacteria bacterium]|nr:MAG: toluene tolerance protein [Betaproteobacteria bacterium]